MATITTPNPIPKDAPNPSQTSSHYPLEPVAGIVLFDQEVRRRDALRPCAIGCRELDESVLLGGGLERGCVVGVSAEEGGADDIGLVMGLQTIARLLLLGGFGGREETKGRRPRAMIITTMGMGAVVRLLREVLEPQIADMRREGGRGEAETDGKEVLKEVLERIAISRVFDVPGLWEVFGELEHLPPSQELGEETAAGSQRGRRNASQEEALGCGGRASSLDVAPDGGQDTTVDAVAPIGEDMEKPSPIAPEIESTEPPSSPLSDPPSSLPDEPPWETAGIEATDLPRRTPPGQREEIQDSDEEGGFLSPLAPAEDSPGRSPVDIATSRPADEQESSAWPGRSTVMAGGPSIEDEVDNEGEPQSLASEVPGATHNEKSANDRPIREPDSTHPDIILITHMSTLLSSLFHQREKASAHEMLQLLASHLRYVTRSPEHGGPLIMILNSTTSADSSNNNNNSSSTVGPTNDGRDGPPIPPGGATTPNRPLDPTLRSIFNPPPLPVSGLSYSYDTPHSRRNKPSFGLIFSQMLDVHLLCTRVPKTRVDAETLYARGMHTTGTTTAGVAYAWAVEVLLDEIGVWEGREKVIEGKPRRSREQRWGAVEVTRDAVGVRIVDAFERKEQQHREVVVAGGFGGRRV